MIPKIQDVPGWPIVIPVLIAVAAILILRCIDSDEAWQSIDGFILVLILAMLIVGAGLGHTGPWN